MLIPLPLQPPPPRPLNSQRRRQNRKTPRRRKTLTTLLTRSLASQMKRRRKKRRRRALRKTKTVRLSTRRSILTRLYLRPHFNPQIRQTLLSFLRMRSQKLMLLLLVNQFSCPLQPLSPWLTSLATKTIISKTSNSWKNQN